MQIFVQLILLILCFLMFKVRGHYKVAILLLSAICFNCVSIPYIPFGASNYILCICFLISEWFHKKKHFKVLKGTILKSLILSIIIATVILAIHSPHCDSIQQFIRLFINELVAKYFVICYAYISIKDEKDLRPLFHLSYYGLLVLTGFAVLNYVTKHAIFIDEMLEGVTVSATIQDGSAFTDSDRFRVQAMFTNPFNYGYICILLLLLNWYGYMKRVITKKRFCIILCCCLCGIILCGCRTNIFCCIIGITVYILLTFDRKKKVKYILLGSFMSVLLLIFIPQLRDKMIEMLSMFNENSEVSGSSIRMRLLQYGAVFYYIQDYVLLGRGLGFFYIDMGWAEGAESLVDKDLFGLEGVLMNHFLERGLVGVCFYLFFYISLLIFTFKIRNVDKQISALCISLLIVYLAFANMTGELSSVFPTLLLVGCCIRLLYNRLSGTSQRHKLKTISNSD